MIALDKRRKGQLVLLAFLVFCVLFSALVTWLVTAPIRERRSRPVAPPSPTAAVEPANPANR